MDLGRLGIWSIELRTADAAAVADAAAELDEAGWGALWIPGLGGGPLLRDAETLLRSTRHSNVAIGVAGEIVERRRVRDVVNGDGLVNDRRRGAVVLID